MKGKHFLLLLLIFSNFILFGCIKKIESTNYVTSESLKYLSHEIKEVNECVALVCEYKEKSIISKIWDWIADKFITTEKKYKIPSLSGGNCSFKTFDINIENEKSSLDKLILSASNSTLTSGAFIQSVMIGSGDSVFIGEEMKSICGGNLGFMIMEVPSTSLGTFDSEVVSSLSDCVLDSGTIPFFKYNKLEYPSLLAEAVSKKGIAFISPGFGFSIKPELNPDTYNPSGQFAIIKTWCPKCLTVATINFNDIDTLNFYKSSGDLSHIDVIGFIVDVNSFDNCNTYSILYDEKSRNSSIKSFAQYVISNYSKPTIVLDVNVREGPNKNNKCGWTNTTIADFYQELIKSIPFLQRSGVVGVSVKDISLLPQEAVNSFGLFCNIYYSRSSPTSSYSSFAIFSKYGDVISQCNSYSENNEILNLEVSSEKYKDIQLSKIIHGKQCGNLFCIDLFSLPLGIFPAEYCLQNSLFIKNMAFKNSIDASILMAALNYKGQYASDDNYNQLYLVNSHCQCKEYDGIKRNICCVAETISYYNSKAKQIFPNEPKLQAYLSLYGIVTGDNGFNGEIYNIQNNIDYLPNPFIMNLLYNARAAQVRCGLC